MHRDSGTACSLLFRTQVYYGSTSGWAFPCAGQCAWPGPAGLKVLIAKLSGSFRANFRRRPAVLPVDLALIDAPCAHPQPEAPMHWLSASSPTQWQVRASCAQVRPPHWHWQRGRPPGRSGTGTERGILRSGNFLSRYLHWHGTFFPGTFSPANERASPDSN